MNSPLFVEHAEPWSDEFVDIASLHASASRAVLQSIDLVRTTAQKGVQPIPQCHLLLGPAGIGKTHLLRRWRKAARTRAAFALQRPELGLALRPRSVLTAVMDSLERRPFGEKLARQSDVVALSALAAALQEPWVGHETALELYRTMSADAREELVAQAVDALEEKHPGLDTIWLERFLRLPFYDTRTRRAAVAWLSGREPDTAQLEKLGLRSPLQEEQVRSSLRALASAASYRTPLVLVFDQLENLAETSEQGDLVRAYGQLVMELFDLTPGLVLVQLALDAEWERRISPGLSASARTRLEANVHRLSLPTHDEREQLVRALWQTLPESERTNFPAPLPSALLEQWLNAPGVTPRGLLLWCRTALETPHIAEPPATDTVGREEKPAETPSTATTPSKDPLQERLEQLWNERVAAARVLLDECAEEKRPLDASHLFASLRAYAAHNPSFQCKAPNAKEPELLRITLPSGVWTLVLAQKSNAKSMQALLERALALAATEQVVVLRERDCPIPPTWKKAQEILSQNSAKPRFRFVPIGRDALTLLLALHDFHRDALSQDLSDAQGQRIGAERVFAFIAQTLDLPAWELLSSFTVSGSETSSSVPVASAKKEAIEGTKAAPVGPAVLVLQRLQLCSLERLLREVRALQPERKRSEVLAELSVLGPRVRWLGDSIVMLEVAP